MENLTWMSLLNPSSPIQEYMKWVHGNGDDRLYEKHYASIVKSQETEQHCFLTVVIRTQGKRRDMLQDVLMCLQAQNDQAFEVVVICHRAEKDAYRTICELVREQEPKFAERMRVYQSEQGERGAPLNLGFAYARGEYAVCLDDDDLVFDHWVREFHAAAREHAGMILHSWALAQHWYVRKTEDGNRQIIGAAGEPETRYCVPYRTLRQQSENYCPFMGLAFPLFLFRKMHVMFSESLSTTEDWDYLLRTAGIAGVWDIKEVTAIYRIWDADDVSRRLVRDEEWKANYRRINQKTGSMPLLLTAEEAKNCREELNGLQSAGQKGRSSFLREAVLFWSDGTDFSGHQYITAPIIMDDGWIRAEFVLTDCSGGRITRIRIDPAEETLFALEHLRVQIKRDNDTLEELSEKNIRETNGITDENSLLFLAEDPRIVFDIEETDPPVTIVFTARVTYRSSAAVTQWAEEQCADARWLADNRNTAHLYLDRGEGFNTEDCVVCENVLCGEKYEARFSVSPTMSGRVNELRFDPTEAEMFRIDQLMIKINYSDGSTDKINASQVISMNGFETQHGMAFIERDPYMYIPISADKQIREVQITGLAGFAGCEEMEDLFAEARRVPSYEQICGQLHRIRENKKAYKEENKQ